jgi:putative salt-induced outer membrane protein YdiY
LFALGITFGWCSFALAQAAAPEPVPLWDTQIGASFVGTTGNSKTSATGVDFSAHRRGLIWQVESTANVVETTDNGTQTAERFIATGRVQRTLMSFMSLSVGERAEHDPLAGMDYRNVLDGGIGWKLVTAPRWTLTGVTAIDWLHEQPKIGATRDDCGGVFQVVSRVPIGSAGETTQRFTYFPDFSTASNYRTEGEITAQAAMNSHLALKLGYLVRYANAPIAGFVKTDNTATASIVLRWKASTAAPTRG